MFYTQAKEIKIWVDNSTDQDKWISEFWSDDIFELTFEPAARIVSLGIQMSKEKELNLAETVELYAKIGMATCDAGIAVWNSKYVYNVERPVSYIRRVMDPNWKTILNNPIGRVYGMTPEFPAYPSGHSGFAGAGTGILADFFGNNNKFTDYSHLNRVEFRGEPRTYQQILDIGIENAYSRLPLGVHYRMDCDEGIRLGYLAAKRVLDLPWKK
ncbi:MAG: vanadium-dependent haloperoxidase [Saprospiraceae bacterium]|nr:vanadium-dependent haloperoxidase [Saprospiraceae bacterium]